MRGAIYLHSPNMPSMRGAQLKHRDDFSSLHLVFIFTDGSVGIALGYGLDDRVSRVQFPAGAGNFSLHHRIHNGSGAHPTSCPMGTRGSFPGGKAAGGVKLTTHLYLEPRSKNAWSYTSTPPIRLHGVVLS
jgi:hypothetical protein